MDESTRSKRISAYFKNGWAPVSTKHHPPHIKRALKAAAFRPGMKECYANSIRMLVGQDVLDFTYVEGVVQSIIPVMHAWLLLGDERVDLTLEEQPKVIYSHTVPREEVLASVQRGWYGPVRERRLTLAYNALLWGVEPEGTDEDIEARIEAVHGRLKAASAVRA